MKVVNTLTYATKPAPVSWRLILPRVIRHVVNCCVAVVVSAAWALFVHAMFWPQPQSFLPIFLQPYLKWSVPGLLAFALIRQLVQDCRGEWAKRAWAEGASSTREVLRGHAFFVYTFLFTPILVLAAFSFNVERRGSKWTGFTTDWYVKLAQDKAMRHAAINSLIVAGVTTIVTTVIGTAAALGLHRLRSGRTAGATRGMLYLPIVIPEIVLGVALVSLFGMLGMKLSLGTVILAHVVFSVSYVAIVVRARLSGIDPSLEEAATDLGAGPVATFVRVTLPLIAPGVIAAALLVFTVSLDDYVVTSLVAGPGNTTLPLKIYAMLKVEVTPQVNAACTVLLAFTVILIALSHVLLAGRAAGDTAKNG